MKQITTIKNYEYHKTEKYHSYGFRLREELPFSNGDVRKIFMKAAKVFRLMAQSKMKDVAFLLENDPELDNLIEKWITWDEKREGDIKHGLS